MDEILQEETTQTTVESVDPGEVVAEAVNTNSSEPAPVNEETVEASNIEPVTASSSESIAAENIPVAETGEAVTAEEISTGISAKPEPATEQKPILELKSVIEALLFVTSDPLELDKIQEIIGTDYSGQKLDKKQVREALAELATDYQNRSSALQLVEIANGWQLCTKKEYAVWLDKLAKTKDVYKLSNSALETLSIIAYKQPLTRAEVEHIRGVDSGGVIHNLLEKRLVRITGRKEVLGHPLLYGTSDEFLQYFGLASIADLPMLEDLNKS